MYYTFMFIGASFLFIWLRDYFERQENNRDNSKWNNVNRRITHSRRFLERTVKGRRFSDFTPLHKLNCIKRNPYKG